MTERAAGGDASTVLASEQDEALSMLEAVRSEAARYRAFFQAAPTALVVTDLALRIVEANEAACRLLQVDGRFLLGKPLSIYVDLKGRRTFRTWLVQQDRSAPSQPLLVRMRRRTGVAFDAHLQASFGDDEIYWTIIDSTAEVHSERSLWELNRELELRVQEQSADLEALVERLHIGVMGLAADGVITWANRRATEILGCVPAAKRQARLLDEEGAPLQGAGEPTETVRRSVRVRRPDDSESSIAITAVPILTYRGGTTVLVEAVTDSERRERADANFVENAAHQLRTPITAIVGAVAALRAGAVESAESRERFLGHIGREADRLGRLVEALLTLAGIERGLGRPLVEVVPLQQLLEESVSLIRSSEGPAIMIDCPSEIAVVGDRDLLGEAIRNVVENAIAHTSGGVQVTAVMNHSRVVLDVTDFGPGVEADVRDAVFERFFRGSGQLIPKGSGLGLAIARAACAANGSSLEVLPQRQGEGATFRFDLPGAPLR